MFEPFIYCDGPMNVLRLPKEVLKVSIAVSKLLIGVLKTLNN